MKNSINAFLTKVAKPAARQARYAAVCMLAVLSAGTALAQVNLIPASDGGFENATVTLAANGWTAANSSGSAWTCGAGAGPFAGTNSGYIASSGTTYGYTNGTNKISHLYRDVTIPAGVNAITLSFQLKSGGTVGNDRFFVSTAPTSVTPTTTSTAGYVTQITGATLVYVQPALITSYTLVAIHLPNTYAGTTVRLIFSWMNDAGTQINPNPASIDNVSLTYMPVPPAAGACGYSFAATGAVHTYSVPIGCSALAIDAWGGAGGTIHYQSSANTSYNLGGLGGRTQATVNVTPSTTSSATVLQVRTGGKGANATTSGGGAGGYNGGGKGADYNANNNGGGGGGASDVRVSPYGLGDRIVVAGGGGGGGFNSGHARQDERGGNGGGTTAEAGYENGAFSATQAGQAGTATAGGAKASGSAVGNDGALGVGGDGTSTGSTSVGGGGGGGYYGGGSGYFGGGGGGSSYAVASATAVTHTQGFSPYNGIVYINPVAPTAFTVTTAGGGGCPGPAPTIGLSGSQTDVNYQLYLSGTAVGSPVTGTGSAISFGTVATSGTYTVAAYYTGYSGCVTVMTGSASVSTSGPDVSSFATAATSPCTGSASTVTITSSTLVSGTAYTVDYTLSGANTGSFSASMTFGAGTGTFSILAANLPNPGATTVTINTVTETATSCSSNPGTGNVANFNVRSAPGAIAGVVTGMCPGSTATLSNPVAGGTWSSGSPARATVSASGIVYGVSPGTAVITYSTGCGTDATISVNISSGGSAISGASTVCVSASTSLSIATTGGTWSSSNLAVATVNSSGIVTGVAAGTVIISYSAGCTSILLMTITAAPDPISGMTTGICSGGGTTTLSNAVSGGTWTSGNPSVATVNATTGVVTGIAVGSADITYSNGCGTDAVVTVSISSGAGAISGATSACVSASAPLSNATSGGVWSSSNPAVATVSTSGVVTGLAAGTVTITYTAGCVSSLAFTVLSAPGPITGGGSLCVGATLALGNAAAGGTWSSSNAGIATVSGAGVVTGVAGGTATITYSTGCGSDATLMVNVNALPSVPAITAAATTTCIGGTIAMSNATGGGVWSSGASGVATVSGTGVVTGVATGTATISYSLTNSCGTSDATISITVGAGSAGTITGADSVCKGAGHEVTLTSSVTGGVWTSSNTARATVNSVTGVVTGVSTGTFTITYTVSNSCGTFTVTHAMYVRTPSKCTSGIGLDEGTDGTVLQVFPNPNAGTFTMKLLSDNKEQAQAVVTNVVGEKVLTFTIGTNEQREIRIDHAPGFYFLTVTTLQGSYVEKIVVLK